MGKAGQIGEQLFGLPLVQLFQSDAGVNDHEIPDLGCGYTGHVARSTDAAELDLGHSHNRVAIDPPNQFSRDCEAHPFKVLMGGVGKSNRS